MLIFGHPWIESPKFVKIFSISEIKKTSPDDILLLEPLNVSWQIAQYCKREGLHYAVTVNSVRDAVFVNALGADFIISEHEMSITIQRVAEDYMFDTKILVLIEEEKYIDSIIRFGIDGVVFPSAITQP